MSEQTFDSAAPLPPVVKSERMRQVEAEHGGADVRVLLMRLYAELGSQREVARALGLAQSTVSDWLSQLGIHTAAWSEAWLAQERR